MAGLVYIDDIDEIFSIIKEGDHLDLFREKDNRYDEHAILVKYDGKKIGYVPRADNIILANLMDAGKMLYGVVVNTYIEYVYVGDEFKVVKFKIFLKEWKNRKDHLPLVIRGARQIDKTYSIGDMLHHRR